MSKFQEYTTDYISGVMSLRQPQQDSLEILSELLQEVKLDKQMPLADKLDIVRKQYPTCTDFERSFPSLAFSLATGVGKTRLIGAFIAHLYTQHDVKNFFIVAPGKIVYEKLKTDLSEPTSSKYVFKGLGCLNNNVEIITGDDYREKQISMFSRDIRIFIYNIDKFNKDNAKMKRFSEYIGSSFYEMLAKLPDLVLIMDESHHYRADQGMSALGELDPVLGLELTATPLAKVRNEQGKITNKQEAFKNVVFEYPLSKAIEDGFTRTPYAITRSDVDCFTFGEEELDKLMLNDGIASHESSKVKLELYASDNQVRLVKPFTLVVCKNTEHARWVETYVKSEDFQDGAYKNKVLLIHSNLNQVEKDAAEKELATIEQEANTVEIVIHVDMLKEGWDVNNLYTIIPLRTASSKILREQMVGRGLRLPYGTRTGDTQVDAVMLTAHDKFTELLKEAEKGDSIFKAGNVIEAKDIVTENCAYTQLSLNRDQKLDEAYQETGIAKTDVHDALLEGIHTKITSSIVENIVETKTTVVSIEQKQVISEKVIEDFKQNVDLGVSFRDHESPLSAWIHNQVEESHREVVNKFIPIPQIKVVESGDASYDFQDFDADLASFTQKPVETKILIQNLQNLSDSQLIQGDNIAFDGVQPRKILVALLRGKPKINYEECSVLLQKIVQQVCDHFREKHGENGLQNIVMMYKHEIATEIFKQMLCHSVRVEGFITEKIMSSRSYNFPTNYGFKEKTPFSPTYTGGMSIKSMLFTGIKKGVFEDIKVDSSGELMFAWILEREECVKNWLRPAKKEFDIYYHAEDGKHQYEPDFVVETEELIYLVEIKNDEELSDPKVLAKKARGIEFCKMASTWGDANGYKKWVHLFIPHSKVKATSTFEQLASWSQTN